ncbi:helix-turn-helix domain-containing protein [Streptomyces sp. NPDC056002]|uniref:helix-turn-helix domain-containing protein n=1 Tax=Streptomyces sp. NPDC056002 TaxID=3345675 RepID=UPI0035DA0813
MTQETDGNGPSPVGRHLSEWRVRRGLAVAGLATRSSLSEELIEGLEAGRDWADRRRVLNSLAAGLRLDLVELTGQPYLPYGIDHSTVHSLGWHARRYLARVLSASGAVREADQGQLAALVAEVRADDDDGDLTSAALKVPGLLELIGPPPPAGNGCGSALRTAAHVSVSRFLRLLGYRDLAWGVLSQARPTADDVSAVLGEEVRLLLDMGQAELAVARAARAEVDSPAEVVLPLALARAALGDEVESERLLATAQGKAATSQQRSQVASAGAFAAAERGAHDRVLDRAAGATCLPAGDRSALLVLTASAHARLGRYAAATEDLLAAESVASVHARLDPLARELVHVLRSRPQEHAEALGSLAGRFGMK